MKNIKILDCTLRDGGRLFNGEFADEMIGDMLHRLIKCRVDIIEIGFLRGDEHVSYSGNSIFFTDTLQIEKFVISENASNIVAFIDYGLYDFSKLRECDGKSITGIRFGFTRKNLKEHRDDVLRCMDIIKQRGYRLYVQSVNTPGYEDLEILDLVEICNTKKPYSYGIVDTYGSMYIDDVRHYFNLVNRNLDEDICIDFHSHNNYQLSFALAQEIVGMAQRSERTVIIDATLNGMGKGAGNLNEELIVDWLIRKHDYNYDFDCMLDIIDDYLKEIRKKNTWGYSIPAMLSGTYRAHPNNMLYLTEKYDLPSKDIRAILAAEEAEERERYNYERLNQLCEEYRSTKVDDTRVIEKFKGIFEDRTILLIMPGSSINSEKDKIDAAIKKENPIIVSVNFIFNTEVKVDKYVFFGSADRYRMFYNKCEPSNTILSSSISSRSVGTNIVNYEGLVDRMNDHFDNSATLTLNFLKKCNAKRILIAGFDGYNDNSTNYFREGEFQSDLVLGDASQINRDIQELFSKFYKTVYGQIRIKFVTSSRYNFPEI